MNRRNDSSVTIENKLFHILAWTAAIANTVGFISNVIFYGMAADTMFYGGCALVMIAIGLLGSHSGRIHGATAMILCLINIVEFPCMYYLYGGGRTVYMLLGIIGVMVFVQKGQRMFYVIVTMIYDAVVLVLSVRYPVGIYVPNLSVDVTQESDLGAGMVSFVIVVVSVTLIIKLLVEQYEAQNEELRQLAVQMEDMAHRDPLTHLYNRRYLTDYLEKRMEEQDGSFAVILLDLDNFKHVNDTYGHVYGDEVLQSLADNMSRVVEGHGIAARYGGEEFMLVLDTTREAEIQTYIQQIKDGFQKFSMETKKITLTFSGGVEFFHKEDRITQLFNAADEKLYSAKKYGKNRIVF